jgi:hypothetical protein
MKKIRIEKTKRGFPAIWEKGGGMTNTGFAQIVANPDGSPKRPVYIRRRGILANAEHALFIVQLGDLIIQAEHHREDFNIYIYKILDFKETKQKEITEEVAIVEQVYKFSRGEWDKELPEYLQEACTVAMEKATCYHCRKPHFIVE